MHRTSKAFALLTWAILVSIVGLAVSPAVLAAPVGQQSAQLKQIVVLDGQGRPTAYSFGTLAPVWQSDEAGWSNFDVGDFNGDGKKEMVLIASNRLRVINPGVPGASGILLDRTLPAGRNFHLLAVGDFRKTGRDSIAASYQYTEGDFHEEIIAYIANPDGTWGEQSVYSYPFQLRAMTAGDVNRDGYADLTIMGGNYTGSGYAQGRMLKIFSGRDLASKLYEDSRYGFDWNAVAVGDMDRDNNDTDHPGLEIAAIRNAGTQTELLFWWRGIDDLQDWTISDYFHYPAFTHVALGDADNDSMKDKEIFLLRELNWDTRNFSYLIMLNPAGPSIEYAFEPKGDCCESAYRQVAAGDVDGDNHDEVVVLRGSDFRVYTQPNTDDASVVVGAPAQGFGTNGLAVADLGFGPTVLQVTPNTIERTGGRGDSVATQVVNITAPSRQATNWTASVISGGSWIGLSKSSGTTDDSTTISINPNAPGLVKGLNTGVVRFTALGVSQNNTTDVAVRFTLKDPSLELSTTSLSFSFSKDDYFAVKGQPINITNGTTQAGLTWEATVSSAARPWLHLDKATGTTPGYLKVSVRAQDAGVGLNTGQVSLVAKINDVVVDAKVVDVVANVTDPGFLVSPEKIGFIHVKGSNAPESAVLTAFRPTAPGSTPLSWVSVVASADVRAELEAAIADGQAEATPEGLKIRGQLVAAPNWLTVSPASGTTNEGDNTMTVTINTAVVNQADFARGTYRALITFFPSGGQQSRTVEVILGVTDAVTHHHLPLVER